MKKRALVIDDDISTLELMKFQLNDAGFEVITAENGKKGLEAVEENEFDVILTDYNLPDLSGMEIVKRSKKHSPETEIIMITGYGSTEKAIEAIKAGAFWFLKKPVIFDELKGLLEKAVEHKLQLREIKELRGKLSNRTSFEGIIGGSRAMQEVYEIIENVAQSDANILILGESGTGKEVIANAVHYSSHRADKPFVKVNCSALPKELIESQLFGHIKGAFTGAMNDKTGFIGQANKGSILLDEIGEMPLDLQPKLLRVLQDRVYYRVGSDKPQEADFRLICATNRNPFEAIKDGNLREDLYYRINTIEIKIPPLRERMEDVPMLAEHFLKIYTEKYNRQGIEFSGDAYRQMLNYSWRGNVRELQHVIERAVLMCKSSKISEMNIPKDFENTELLENLVTLNNDNNYETNGDSQKNLIEANLSGENWFEEIGKIIVQNLPEPNEGETVKDIFDLLENGIVSAALQRTKGNKQAAANLLGLYRPRLYGMIKRHNL